MCTTITQTLGAILIIGYVHHKQCTQYNRKISKFSVVSFGHHCQIHEFAFEISQKGDETFLPA